jgi:rod shape-determining protein MreC
MRNLIFLIRRFQVLLIFLMMQGLCLSLLVSYNRSHRARYLHLAYETTGRVEKRYNYIQSYFALRENNVKLAEENNRLRNLLPQNLIQIDTSSEARMLLVPKDSSMVLQKYLWRRATVINNSVSRQNNYITVERGSQQGISPGMAVTGAGGIVGLVTDVSSNMAIVMSLLHRKSVTSVSLKKTGTNGLLEWDGENPQYLQLKGIPKSVAVAVGDTLITSNISLNYPPGLMVGTIAKVAVDPSGNNLLLQVRPGANFYSLDHVDIIENTLLKEQRELEQRSKNRQ